MSAGADREIEAAWGSPLLRKVKASVLELLVSQKRSSEKKRSGSEDDRSNEP